MTGNTFSGDKKVGQSMFSVPEKKLVAWGTPKIPVWLETYHLTLLTILWSALNVLFGCLARNDIRWLWLISLMIVMQYITDLFDGAVGRARNTGLVKWGFYMDHFLDYIFLCSLVFAGYMIAPQGLGFYYVILLMLTGGFMVNSFLGFAATNRFEIYFYGFGPTEMRVVFILINTAIILTGTNHFVVSVPATCLVCLIGLVFMVWRTSRRMWALDMAGKQAP
ncbi:CDP-alcohol phosphatidyltransferase family protein [bacterium]|nr:CDP-alcohol phosphatidyltransferase family protein [candidate division CSSED10-310 bacterium]